MRLPPQTLLQQPYVKAASVNAMESTVEEERSTFDYDDTQGVEGSEELLEMDSFEYDEEELPLNDAQDRTATIKRLKGRGGGDHIELGGFRYSYQTTLKNGTRFYRCVLRGGASLGCNARLYEDPVSGEVTLSGEHVHDAKSAKTRTGSRNRDKSVSGRTLQTKKVHGDGGPRRKGDRRAKADTFNRSAKDDPPPPQGERSVPWAVPAKSIRQLV
ncbi:hypothetical protein AAVH_28555 [Aphelenchoides avenae]|nr:hypothetical protein AAVH_28555 [Aphelenchus avenae]